MTKHDFLISAYTKTLFSHNFALPGRIFTFFGPNMGFPHVSYRLIWFLMVYSTSQESASRIQYGEFLLIISAYFYICLYDSARSSTSINDILLYYELFINRNGSDFPSQGKMAGFFGGAQLNSPILSEFLETFLIKVPIITSDFFAEL